MKRKIFLIVLFGVALISLAHAQSDDRKIKTVPDTTVADSTEYELVVFDQGFETWYLMQPSNQHSQEFYKNKNRLYVSEWNQRYMAPSVNRNIYNSYIDYDPRINYGLEFEQKLYYYFKYFEKTNHVTLIPGSR